MTSPTTYPVALSASNNTMTTNTVTHKYPSNYLQLTTANTTKVDNYHLITQIDALTAEVAEWRNRALTSEHQVHHNNNELNRLHRVMHDMRHDAIKFSTYIWEWTSHLRHHHFFEGRSESFEDDYIYIYLCRDNANAKQYVRIFFTNRYDLEIIDRVHRYINANTSDEIEASNGQYQLNWMVGSRKIFQARCDSRFTFDLLVQEHPHFFAGQEITVYGTGNHIAIELEPLSKEQMIDLYHERRLGLFAHLNFGSVGDMLTKCFVPRGDISVQILEVIIETLNKFDYCRDSSEVHEPDYKCYEDMGDF